MMNSLNSLWNLIATGTLRVCPLIACILLLRLVFRHRLSAQCFHFLWLVTAVRLLLPVVPGSPLSIFNIHLPIERSADSPASKWVVRKETVAAAAALPKPSIPRAQISALPPHDPINFSALFASLWMGGVCCQLILLGRAIRRMRRLTRDATLITDQRLLAMARQCARDIGLRKIVPLLETNGLTGPAVGGLWRAQLLLPRNFAERLSDSQLRSVLLHECAHLRRYDIASMWLWKTARIVHWFNPLVWLAHRAARTDTEVACDETVLRHTDKKSAQAYGETLLALAQLVTSREEQLPVAAIFENKGSLRTRLMSIAHYTPRTRRHACAVGILILTVSLVFGADEQQRIPSGSDDSGDSRQRQVTEELRASGPARPEATVPEHPPGRPPEHTGF